MKKEPKVFEVRKLFRILVVGGTLTAAGCGSPPCQPPDAGPDGGAPPNNCYVPPGGGGGPGGW
jgi:hypothetical protein